MIFVYNKRRTLNRVKLAIRYEGICGAWKRKDAGAEDPVAARLAPLTSRRLLAKQIC